MPYLIDCSSCDKYTPPSDEDPTKCQLCFDEDEAVRLINPSKCCNALTLFSMMDGFICSKCGRIEKNTYTQNSRASRAV